MLLDLLNIDWTWVLTGILAIVIFFCGTELTKRRGLPPGPFPLPFVGNLKAITSKKEADVLVTEWRSKYGNIFTLWMGPEPVIVVCGWDEIKEALITMKNAFSGRLTRYTGEIFLDGHQDVIMSNYSPLWETLRKLLHQAVRQYSSSDQLPILINDILDEVVPLMIAEKEPFDPTSHLYLTVYNIVASTAFGKKYDIDDEEFLTLKNTNEDIQKEINFGVLWDLFPFMRHILRTKHKRAFYLTRKFKKPIENQYRMHKESYVKGTIRDITDACIAAKEEALLENKDTAKYLTDENMILVLFDFFAGGSDTTRITFTWIIMFLCQQPDIQDKIRTEIKDQLGERMAVQEDKHKCPFTMAVIEETLRFRSIVSFSLERSTTQDVHFRGYQFRKGTRFMFHYFSQHMNPEYWKDPEVFRPERFLDKDGQLINTINLTGLVPFGMGRRSCPGEKLAMADLFLLTTGLVRRCRVSFPDGPGSADLTPQNLLFINLQREFKLKVEKLNS